MMRAWMMLATLTGSYAMADQEFKHADECENGEAPNATQVSFFHPNGESPKPQPQRTCLVAVPNDVECEEVPPNAEDLCYAYEKYSLASYTNTQEKGHFFVTGDFIYWKPTEENLGYVAVTTQTTFQNTISSPTIQDSDVELVIKKPHLKYQGGFEVGFGFDFPPEAHWDALVNWTDYRTKATAHKDIPFVDPNTIPNPPVGSFQITTLTPLLFFNNNGIAGGNGGFYNSASAAWRLHVDLLDLEIGRRFFIGKWVSLRPFFGVRAERIKESYHTAYSQPASTSLLADQ
ncbi:MAG TPA: Lpg1974 family pore-forming outer membrane protein, partial [Rhabdochlamydiaceae bacterium]